jgi:hypothetical protein
MTRGWLDSDYKRHRQVLLLDRERSLLPATQPAVEHEVECRKRGAIIAELGEKSTALGDQIRELTKKIDAVSTESYRCRLELQAEKNNEKIKELTEKNTGLKELEQTLQTQKYDLWHQQDDMWKESHVHQQFIKGPKQAKERRAFVAACPSSGCRGFLSTAYKCGTCQVNFCSDCREPSEEEHTCDPALVATIKAILADSKACPACGVSISRVSGCDQMYCTQCDTPFSYSTGAVIKGVIHNPHYFERMHAAAATATANGGAGGCPAAGVWPPPPQRSANPAVARCYRIPAYYQAGLHVQEVVLREELRLEEPDNTDLRVKYLLKDIDDKEFSQKLQQRDKVLQFKRDLRGPLELFVITTLEYFQNLEIDPPTDFSATYDRESVYKRAVKDLINKPLQEISHRYGRQVPQIDLKEGYKEHAYPPRVKKDKMKVPAAGALPLPG